MTNEPMALAAPLNPSAVLAQVATALPQQLRSNVIICGSLAAAYNFFSGDGAASLRTKDVDMLLSPHAVAVDAAVEVTEQLLASNWKQRDAKFGTGGRPEDEIKDLPVVRLRPPPGAGAGAVVPGAALGAAAIRDGQSRKDQPAGAHQRRRLHDPELHLPCARRMEADQDPARRAHRAARDDGAGQHAPPSTHPR